MSIRDKITRRLNTQAQHEGESANIVFLRRALGIMHDLSAWHAITSVAHHRYGPLSYEAHVFYYAKPWIVELCADLTPPDKHLAQIRGTLAPILDESGQSAGFGVIE